MKDTTAILNTAYKEVESKLKVSANLNNYRKCVSRFINTRAQTLYSNMITEKMYFSEDDIVDFYKSTNINRTIIKQAISNTYYYEISNFNPRYAKDDFVIAILCVIRYLKLHNLNKDLDLALIHMSCSGKFYTSIFVGSFPVTDPQPHIMEYVVTNMCTNKFDIVREGNLIGAMKSISNTWLSTYNDKFKDFHDDDVVYLIQQLHNRIRSFMSNIAELYYEAYKNKDLYISYDSDDVSDDEYRLADSDSFKMNRVVENTMTVINSHGVDYRLCKMSSNSLVKMDELKMIIDNISSKPENLVYIKELISIIVATYYAQSKTKDVRDLDFITYSIQPKPNTKDKNLLRERELLNILLLNNADAFRRRRTRGATEQAYYKAILAYYSLQIQQANK